MGIADQGPGKIGVALQELVDDVDHGNTVVDLPVSQSVQSALLTGKVRNRKDGGY
jgi:hypothetical protein